MVCIEPQFPAFDPVVERLEGIAWVNPLQKARYDSEVSRLRNPRRIDLEKAALVVAMSVGLPKGHAGVVPEL
jgi:hypothetical protein